jgi:hypothetical protein
MSKTSGQLLWRRMQITLPPFSSEIDTGLCQRNLAFDTSSNNEPTLGAVPIPPDRADGSRVQVIPLSPISAWTGVRHTEPFLSPTTGTVHVQFVNFTGGGGGDPTPQPVTINVLFWDPATAMGPGAATSYVVPFVPPGPPVLHPSDPV